ncbi:MAG: TlpA family protein disulfide reductase [Fibrobacter sp.]|nr:TlpA family protein disulfide reductase [Fibrobacter sp.]
MRLKSVKIVLLAGGIILACILFAAYKEISHPFSTMPTSIVNFAALDVSGEKTDYNREKGYATLIVLSASWCPACMAEMPTLKKIHQEFSGKGLNILMVSEDDNLKAAAKFKRANSIPWTVVHWNYELMNALGNPRVIPVSYLVNGSDEIVLIEAGILDEQKVHDALEKILE